ncbi:proton-conducting transporter membrane subunit [Devosia albogilva]|uniref:Proton-conducting transporter membrane subunit n=1 Tax=Devosia albogilva TaxID=429726 RepID=A0ABW5QNV9_9HYPH
MAGTVSQPMIDFVTSPADWVIVLPLVLNLLGAALALMLANRQRWTFVLSVAVVLAVITCEVALLARIAEVGPVSMTMGKWLPPFGISFAADAFGAGFALAAAVVTLLVLVYAENERDGDASKGFHPLTLLLLAGVTGSFLTGDLFNLYVWFEVMLISSFGLIVIGGKPVQLDGAVKYGFLNFLATAFFLLSLGLLYGLLGTLNMADIRQAAPEANPAAMTAVAGLLLLAFGMKAAAFPVNAWLPASYHTPPAAISALFAGLLTKVGVFVLLRVMIVLLPASRDVLEPVLAVVAAATLVIAPLGAIAETNLRRAIGFVVIGGIGVVLVGLVVPTEQGVGGAGFYVFHAILTMTALYLVAGLIERATGTTDTRRMGGLYAADAPLSILFFVLVLAAAGVPPFLGFWPKLMLLQASIGAGDWAGFAMTAALLVNAVLTLIAGARLWAFMFWRSPPDLVPQSAEKRAGTGRVAASGILVAVVVAAGLWPNPVVEAVRIGAADFLDPSRYVTAVGLAGGAP